MPAQNYKVRDLQPTLLRLDPDLRHRLMRDAKANGRSLTKEIELLLQQAVDMRDGGREASDAYPLSRATVVHAEEGQVLELTELQRAMLSVFDRLGPEKQLALLSLFK
jgi:hypothetical protein